MRQYAIVELYSESPEAELGVLIQPVPEMDEEVLARAVYWWVSDICNDGSLSYVLQSRTQGRYTFCLTLEPHGDGDAWRVVGQQYVGGDYVAPDVEFGDLHAVVFAEVALYAPNGDYESLQYPNIPLLEFESYGALINWLAATTQSDEFDINTIALLLRTAKERLLWRRSREEA